MQNQDSNMQYILNFMNSEDLPMIVFLSISEALIFGSICNSRLSIPMLLSSRYSHCSLVNSSENWRCILLFFLQHRHLNESQLNEFILSAKEKKIEMSVLLEKTKNKDWGSYGQSLMYFKLNYDKTLTSFKKLRNNDWTF